MSTRGIVVSPPFEITEEGATHFEDFNLDPVHLRECALYWDLIDLPEQRIIGFPAGPKDDVELLEQEGMFIRSEVDIVSFSGTPGAALFAAQVIAANRHNEEGGKWSLGQTTSQLVLPDAQSNRARVAEVELYRAVPVPLGDVPMERVLEFKSKRRDELIRYRETLDSLYEEIASSHDIPRTKTKKIEQVRESVADLNRVMNESKLSRTLRTVKAELSISDLITTGVTATFDLQAAAVVGLGTLGLKIDAADIIDPISDDLRDYAYVSHAQDEFGPES